jgi:transposase InsO family protein
MNQIILVLPNLRDPMNHRLSVVHYNTIRPHSALGYRPPAPEIIVPRKELPMSHEAA